MRSSSGSRSCMAINPYNMRGVANAIYQVRMVTLKCTTRSSSGLRCYLRATRVRCCPSPVVCVLNGAYHSNGPLHGLVPIVDMGAYSHGILSIHRNHFCYSTLNVPLGSATCPGAGLLGQFQPSSKLLRCSNLFPTTHGKSLSELPVDGVLDLGREAVEADERTG